MNFKARECTWVLAAAFAGALLAFFQLGWRVINPTSLDWLKMDSATAYLGWAFLRQDPHWHFPLSFSPHLCYPVGACAAGNDSVPLAAVICKLLRMPSNWQYLGFLGLGNSMLQVVFGFLLCRRFTESKALAFSGSVLFGIAPPFLYRFSGHFSTNGQWLILAALWIYLETRIFQTERRRVLYFSILMFIVGGISPYLSIMALMIVGARFAQSLLDDRRFSIRRLALFTVPAFIMIVSWIIFGFINPWESSEYSGEGYRYFSMNLLSPIDPMGNALLLKRQLIFPGQYEGYNYLGLGVLLLLTLLLCSNFYSFIQGVFSRRVRCLLVVFIGCTLLAASAKITIGSVVFCDLPLPHFAEAALSLFRSSGRLFWPGYYLILTFAVGSCLRSFGGARGGFILVAITVIQFLDLHDLRADLKLAHSFSARTQVTLLKDPFWKHSGRRFKKLIVLPPWQARSSDQLVLGGEDSWHPFGKLAAEQGMMTNVIYQGRARPSDLKMQIETLPSRVRNGELENHAVYVLVPRYLPWFLAAKAMDISGKRVDGMAVFWKSRSSQDNLAKLWDLFRKIRADAGPVHSLSEIATGFEMGGPEVTHDWENGFTTKDGSYVWSIGNSSGFPILWKANSPPPKTLALDMNPFLTEMVKEQRFTAYVNGKLAGDFSLKKQSVIYLDLGGVVEGDQRGTDQMLMLTFKWNTACSPKSLGISNDGRVLAAGIRSIKCLQKEQTQLRSRFWAHAGERFKRLIVLPPRQAPWSDNFAMVGEDAWHRLGKLADEQGMSINVTYEPRPGEAELEMETFPALAKKDFLESDALYLLLPRYLPWLLAAGYKDISGNLVDGLPVFWKSPSSDENVAALWDLYRKIQSASEPVHTVSQVGTGFELGGPEILHDWESGFSTKDHLFIWTLGNMSEYPILRKANSGPTKAIEIDVNPLVGGELKEQIFSVFLNGKRLGDVSLSGQKVISLPVAGLLEEDQRGKDRMLMLTFEWKTACSPKSLGINNDDRVLAVGIRSIKCL